MCCSLSRGWVLSTGAQGLAAVLFLKVRFQGLVGGKEPRQPLHVCYNRL